MDVAVEMDVGWGAELAVEAGGNTTSSLHPKWVSRSAKVPVGNGPGVG